MSKLADRIRKASRLEPAPMGFGAGAARIYMPTMLCLVRLSGSEANKAGDAAAKGADAVILEGAEAGELKDQADRLALGVRLGKADRAAVAAQRQAGAHFVVLDAESTPAEALLEEGIGLVLALGRSFDDTSLRLLGELPLEALLVPAPDDPLTLPRLLDLRRISALSRTPLLIEVAPGAPASYLHALREAGTAGVIIDARSLDRLPALRQTIESLPPRGRRREERAEAVLPAQPLAVAAEDEEEDYP